MRKLYLWAAISCLLNSNVQGMDSPSPQGALYRSKSIRPGESASSSPRSSDDANDEQLRAELVRTLGSLGRRGRGAWLSPCGVTSPLPLVNTDRRPDDGLMQMLSTGSSEMSGVGRDGEHTLHFVRNLEHEGPLSPREQATLNEVRDLVARVDYSAAKLVEYWQESHTLLHRLEEHRRAVSGQDKSRRTSHAPDQTKIEIGRQPAEQPGHRITCCSPRTITCLAISGLIGTAITLGVSVATLVTVSGM